MPSSLAYHLLALPPPKPSGMSRGAPLGAEVLTQALVDGALRVDPWETPEGQLPLVLAFLSEAHLKGNAAWDALSVALMDRLPQDERLEQALTVAVAQGHRAAAVRLAERIGPKARLEGLEVGAFIADWIERAPRDTEKAWRALGVGLNDDFQGRPILDVLMDATTGHFMAAEQGLKNLVMCWRDDDPTEDVREAMYDLMARTVAMGLGRTAEQRVQAYVSARSPAPEAPVLTADGWWEAVGLRKRRDALIDQARGDPDRAEGPLMRTARLISGWSFCHGEHGMPSAVWAGLLDPAFEPAWRRALLDPLAALAPKDDGFVDVEALVDPQGTLKMHTPHHGAVAIAPWPAAPPEGPEHAASCLVRLWLFERWLSSDNPLLIEWAQAQRQAVAQGWVGDRLTQALTAAMGQWVALEEPSTEREAVKALLLDAGTAAATEPSARLPRL